MLLYRTAGALPPLGEGYKVMCVAFQNKGAERLARPFLDVSSQVENGEIFITKGWWGLERVGMGLFTCLIRRSQLASVRCTWGHPGASYSQGVSGRAGW